MAATNYVGRLGPAVFYMRHGVNINRALAAEVSNPQTAEQMTQRNRLTNVVRAYQANKSWMELLAYESVPQGRTLYNDFVSQNLPSSFIYLTKAEVSAYTSILAPYRMTRGSLTNISGNWDLTNYNFVTSLSAGSAEWEFDTLGGFSRVFLANNPEWEEGDQLSVIVNAYQTDSLPMVYAYEITLDTQDTSSWNDVPMRKLITPSDGKINLQTETLISDAGTTPVGILVCQSRKQGGKVLVSTQELVLNAPAITMYSEYSGAAAQQRARRSYGGVGEPFLNPGDQIPIEETFKVTFTGAGAQYATAKGDFTDGGLVTIHCATPSGYVFNGWSGDVTGSESDNPMTFTITKDMTISCNIIQSE